LSISCFSMYPLSFPFVDNKNVLNGGVDLDSHGYTPKQRELKLKEFGGDEEKLKKDEKSKEALIEISADHPGIDLISMQLSLMPNSPELKRNSFSNTFGKEGA
ncbi:hypothetical protein LCGC14_2349530, partial [marine sediment metagenome]